MIDRETKPTLGFLALVALAIGCSEPHAPRNAVAVADTGGSGEQERERSSGESLGGEEPAPARGPTAAMPQSPLLAASNERRDGELYQDPPRKVVFEWTDVNPASFEPFVSETGSVRGTLRNDTETPFVVEMRVDGDAGTNHTFALPVEFFELEPLEELPLVVDVDAFGFDYASQQFSGRASVKFLAFESLATPFVDVTYGAPLFFHQQDGTLRFYGATALVEVYHAGDFAQREEIVPAEGTVIARIVSGTRVKYSPEPRTEESVEAEGDDAAPPNGEEIVQ
jgi:hypothetical protein